MKHSDLMVLHKIKYKHIGIMLLMMGALSSIWTFEGFEKGAGFLPFLYAIISSICILVLVIGTISHIGENWEKTIL